MNSPKYCGRMHIFILCNPMVTIHALSFLASILAVHWNVKIVCWLCIMASRDMETNASGVVWKCENKTSIIENSLHQREYTEFAYPPFPYHIWEWCHWKASHPIRTLRYCTNRPCSIPPSPSRVSKMERICVERRWMPSLPLNEFDQTKRVEHRPWSIHDAYAYSLALIQDAPKSGGR